MKKFFLINLSGKASLVTTTFLFLLVNYAAAFEPSFTYLGIEQGLSNNSVRCIYKDHNGFMWFGTYDGLNRYDGYGFKVFRNKLNDSSSLPHNYVYCINEDLHNNLWIGTGQGIAIYSNLTSKFQPAYFFPNRTKVKQRVTYNVNAIKTDAKGNIFIATNGGGLLVQLNDKDVAVQLPCKELGKQSYNYNVQAIGIDKRQRVWLFILDVGLCMYNYAEGKIELVNNDLKGANCLQADEEEGLWIGSSNGLYKYSIATNSVVKQYNEARGNLSSENVACISFDNQKNLWIGTEGGGIDILNTATDKIDYLLPGESKNRLNSESVYAIYHDNEGRKWMGTLKGGINKIDPLKNQFQTISHDLLNTNSLVNNFVSSFYEDENKNLWIGTDGGGLSIWNRRINSFTNYKHDPSNINSISNNSVTCIRRDELKNIWLATFGGGVEKFNIARNSFEHYKCINEITGEENKKVWLLFEDQRKNLWATTFGNGKIYRFNKQLNKFQVFNQEINDVIALTEDRNGNLWAGNSHQLIKIDRENKNHIKYEIGKPVRAIYEDKANNLWVGTEGGGLILFDRKDDKITSRYSDADGLCNNSVLNILEDGKNHLWLSTFNGLSEFNKTDKTFKNFYQDDGLQSNQFLYSASLKLQSSELAFGGIKGFNLFNPDSIRSRRLNPPVLLTVLRINNASVTSDHLYVTKTLSDQIAAVKVPFDEASFSFDFAALEYSAPGKISYAYFLENWDKAWNYVGTSRTANYSHLREGHYTLRIKSTNPDGIWNKNETILNINVLPPWFRTWWAYVMYLLAAVSLIYFYMMYRARQTRLEYEVKIANINAEKEREISEKKLSFFTDVSHEFRTPLTLIINPIKDLLSNSHHGEEHKQLNVVYRNSRRLLSLVDQLLLFRKADTEGDVLNISKVDFTSLCKEVYLCFVQQAKAKNIVYQFQCASDAIELYVDKEKMEIALFNLVSNALKYTQEGGMIQFAIIEYAQSVEVVVSDNGPGIPKEIGEKIFDKFYRVPDSNHSSKVGFGIGLYLVKQFVEKHNGEITYVNLTGQGTSFKMILKKGYSHLPQVDIMNTSVENESTLLGELVEEPAIIETSNQLETLVSDRQSILVVDDDSQLRQYVANIFRNKFMVYEAQSGEEGLELANKNTPDIIISDVSMQGLSGIDLCKSIKESPQLGHTPVILLTGTASKETRLKGVELGADDYITKPFEKELLMARVENLLKSRNLLHKYFYNEITLQKNTLKVSGEYKEFLDNCISIVQKHLNDDQFAIQTLAAEIGMSHSALYKKVKSISGQSVNSFIRFIRLRKVAELLISSDCNVNEAAFQAGFRDIKYFRLQFNKLFGMNPSDYVKKFRKPFNKNYTLSETFLPLN